MAAAPLPSALAHWLAARPGEHYAAGQALLAPDAAPAHGLYLRSGLVRLYSLGADGGVYNHDFLGTGDWAFGRVAWRDGALCCGDLAIGVEALQPTEAVKVPVAEFERWRRDDPEVGAYLLDALMRMTAARMGREADLARRRPEQRYLALLARQPDILQHVPLRQIAAWLGITPVALSRIRRRLDPGATGRARS